MILSASEEIMKGFYPNFLTLLSHIAAISSNDSITSGARNICSILSEVLVIKRDIIVQT